jgi:hypothetical protein
MIHSSSTHIISTVLNENENAYQPVRFDDQSGRCAMHVLYSIYRINLRVLKSMPVCEVSCSFAEIEE